MIWMFLIFRWYGSHDANPHELVCMCIPHIASWHCGHDLCNVSTCLYHECRRQLNFSLWSTSFRTTDSTTSTVEVIENVSVSSLTCVFVFFIGLFAHRPCRACKSLVQNDTAIITPRILLALFATDKTAAVKKTHYESIGPLFIGHKSVKYEWAITLLRRLFEGADSKKRCQSDADY